MYALRHADSPVLRSFATGTIFAAFDSQADGFVVNP
jgi:hypothetical protein